MDRINLAGGMLTMSQGISEKWNNREKVAELFFQKQMFPRIGYNGVKADSAVMYHSEDQKGVQRLLEFF